MRHDDLLARSLMICFVIAARAGVARASCGDCRRRRGPWTGFRPRRAALVYFHYPVDGMRVP